MGCANAKKYAKLITTIMILSLFGWFNPFHSSAKQGAQRAH
jgi:hypothetical protein